LYVGNIAIVIMTVSPPQLEMTCMYVSGGALSSTHSVSQFSNVFRSFICICNAWP